HIRCPALKERRTTINKTRGGSMFVHEHIHHGVIVMTRTFGICARLSRLSLACAAALCVAAATGVARADDKPSGPRVLFQAPLADAPGKNLVVVELNPPPHPEAPSTPEHHRRGHRHPGSVYVYVTQGAVRLGLEGQPVQVVHAGESFFEPVGAHHIIGESASATEPARAIAVMIVPDGAPLTTLDEEK
ncbi:MAG TPA: cupin domain-containing protein, partial [Gammaproteobacteria bacterium]|nr:cupin domain-containing protein [Gammaproteobacteria bacterium]